ncbi:hypothetical protein GGF50DRAFT_43470 [Schizophyllum commune]
MGSPSHGADKATSDASPACPSSPSAAGPSADAAIPDVACPTEAPSWFAANFALLNRPELGSQYLYLLDAWINLEAANNFIIGKGNKAKLAALKPELLRDWIQAGRAPRCKKLPAVINVDNFGKSVKAWWEAMQPSWRKDAVTGLLRSRRPRPGETWGVPLEVRGQNGMLSVVVCVCWWGLALGRASDEGRASWVRLTTDVALVCQQMSL